MRPAFIESTLLLFLLLFLRRSEVLISLASYNTEDHELIFVFVEKNSLLFPYILFQ